MNLVDSSGWLEYFAGTSYGERFSPLIRRAADLLVPTITIYEVFKRVSQQRDEEEALKAIGLMSTGVIADLTQTIAVSAAVLSIEHRLPMAGSIILATARFHAATLWTQDEHFKGLLGVEYLPKT